MNHSHRSVLGTAVTLTDLYLKWFSCPNCFSPETLRDFTAFTHRTILCYWNPRLFKGYIFLYFQNIPSLAFYCQVISAKCTFSLACPCVCASHEYTGACLSTGFNPLEQCTSPPLSWVTKRVGRTTYLRPNVWDCSKWKREFIFASVLTAISLSIRSCRSTTQKKVATTQQKERRV